MRVWRAAKFRNTHRDEIKKKNIGMEVFEILMKIEEAVGMPKMIK